MKSPLMKSMLALGFAGLVSIIAHAEEPKPSKEPLKHHPNSMAAPMTGHMEEHQKKMKEMMHDCTAMKKDGKTCDHETMEKCQKDMSKGDCQKMMKEAKKESRE